MTGVPLTLPDEAVELIAQRAADIMLERLRAEREPAPETSPYMTVKEAAEYLRCKRQRIDDLLSSGRLTRVKEGGRTLVLRDEIEAHLRECVTGRDSV